MADLKSGQRVITPEGKKGFVVKCDGGRATVQISPEEFWSGSVSSLKITNSAPYTNGRSKAEAYLNQKMESVGVKVENGLRMTVEDIIKGAREGRWEPQEDVEGKRPGQHVWVKRQGKDIHIEVK